MAKRETDKPPVATPARTATGAGDEGAPTLTGLLGGELDLVGAVGLGLGASPEAKRLVLLGMCLELMMDVERRLAESKPKRGRPKSDVTIDMKRAAAVLGADDLWREKTGKGLPSQKTALETAMQIDKILVSAGARDAPLFEGVMTTFARLQTSVSKGLTELGETGRFSKN